MCVFRRSRSAFLPAAGPQIYPSNLSLSLSRPVEPSMRPPPPASILPSDASVHNPTLCLTPEIGSIEHPYPCSSLRAGLIFQLGSILRHNNPPPPFLLLHLPDAAATPPSCISVLGASLAFCTTERQRRTSEPRLTKGAHRSSPEPRVQELASIDQGVVGMVLLIET